MPGVTGLSSQQLGSTGERICLAGDSAGGNLCLTVSLRAAAYGVRVPDGIMAAYPVTTLQSAASPSRLMSLIDPLLPLSVLSKCVSAYSGKAHALRVAARCPHAPDPPSVCVRTAPRRETSPASHMLPQAQRQRTILTPTRRHWV